MAVLNCLWVRRNSILPVFTACYMSAQVHHVVTALATSTIYDVRVRHPALGLW